MYLSRCKQRSGNHCIVLVEGYRDKKTGKVKHRVIKSMGVEEQLIKENNDPNIFEHLKEAQRNSQAAKRITITLDTGKPNSKEEDFLTYSHAWIEKYYNMLGLEDCMDKIQSKTKKLFNLNDVLKTLVIGRCFTPDSKKATCEEQVRFYNLPKIDLNGVYRSLDVLAEQKENILNCIQEHVQGRDTSVIYYDVTNFWFEADPDGFRERGCSKENRPNPIVQMGLFIDNNGLPVDYQLFEGNMPDCSTLVPAFEEVKQKYHSDKIIITADKGLNSGHNIHYILDQGNGYIVSQSVRRSSQEFKDRVLDQEGYTTNPDGSFKVKEFIQEREIKGSNGTVRTIKEKVVCFWSQKYQIKESSERDALLEDVQRMVNNPSLYKQSNHKGLKKYILDPTKPDLRLNTKKIEEDYALDGYYTIITSELDLSAGSIIEKYRGLWRIEESFRVLKTDLEGRPVYVRTRAHIEAHFLICFIALLIMRMMEKALKRKYSVSALREGLKLGQCAKVDSAIYQIRCKSNVIRDLEARYRVKFDVSYATPNMLAGYAREVTRAVTTK